MDFKYRAQQIAVWKGLVPQDWNDLLTAHAVSTWAYSIAWKGLTQYKIYGILKTDFLVSHL